MQEIVMELPDVQSRFVVDRKIWITKPWPSSMRSKDSVDVTDNTQLSTTIDW
jgi:hypothetical protein